MSPSFAPTSMNAAITSVYRVIAVWTPWIDVSRSSTICEIATFMTLVSSTITNWADANITSGIHLRTSATIAAGTLRMQLRLDGAMDVAVDPISAESIHESIRAKHGEHARLDPRKPQRRAVALEEIEDRLELLGPL